MQRRGPHAPQADEWTRHMQGRGGSTVSIQAEAEGNGETVRSNAYAITIDDGGNGGGGGDDDDSCEPMTPCPN